MLFGCADKTRSHMKPLKCVLIGEAGVGKSSLASRWVNGKFDAEKGPTMGAAYLTRRVTVDGVTVNVDVWDTAGQERYRALTPMYSRGAEIAIIVFDATEKPTQQRMQVADWRERLKETAPNAIVAAAGNKCDLCSPGPSVPAKSPSDATYWTSALTNENVDELFHDVVKHALSRADAAATRVTLEVPDLVALPPTRTHQRCAQCFPR